MVAIKGVGLLGVALWRGTTQGRGAPSVHLEWFGGPTKAASSIYEGEQESMSVFETNPEDNDAMSMLYHGPRLVALGDLHGDLSSTLLVLFGAKVINGNGNWIGGSTLVVQVGDIVDRGPDGKLIFDFFEALRCEAVRSGGRVLTLLGNHEVLNMCRSFTYANPAETSQFGGLTGRDLAFSSQGRYGAFLRQCPIAVKVNDTVFTHAGILPAFAKLGFRNLHSLAMRALDDDCSLHWAGWNWPYRRFLSFYDERDVVAFGVVGPDGPLWTRLYALAPEPEACPLLQQSLTLMKARRMVVGHSVTASGTIETRCKGRLILIDTGISRWMGSSVKALLVEKNPRNHDWNYFELGFKLAIDAEQNQNDIHIRKPSSESPALHVFKRPLPVFPSSDSGPRDRSTPWYDPNATDVPSSRNTKHTSRLERFSRDTEHPPSDGGSRTHAHATILLPDSNAKMDSWKRRKEPNAPTYARPIGSY